VVLGLTMVAASVAFSMASCSVSAGEPNRQFDGAWDTVLSCVNTNGALGYSFEFVSTVKDGVLHGEKGEQGKPGWLSLDGNILVDGSANLYVQGLVGAAPFAVGQRPAGTAYGYHLDSKFIDASGKGTRVEGRPCNATFAKQGVDRNH
jgi:hypothetical protein